MPHSTGYAVALTLALFPAALAAQGVAVQGTMAGTSHYLMPSLAGPTISTTVGRRRPGAAYWRASVEHLTGDAARRGTTCAGLVQDPSTCPEEPLEDDARLTSAAAALCMPVWRRPRGGVTLVIEGRAANGWARTRGLTTGRELATSQLYAGVDAGAVASLRPMAHLPVALTVGGTIGTLQPLPARQVTDGYQPLRQGMTVRQLQVGLAWR